MRMRAMVLILLLAPSAFGQARSWRFDMGTAKSPVAEGFQQVTTAMDYTARRGFGWVGKGKLRDGHREIPESLGCDFVLGPALFRVDVPAGDYHVWVLLGDSGHGINHPRFWSTPYVIEANGRKVVSAAQSVETYYRDYYFANLYLDWAPGQSLWEKYFAKYDRPHEFAVTANDQIELKFSWETPVNAVVIHPAGAQAEAERFVSSLREARRKQFDSAFRLVGPADSLVTPRLTADEEARAAAPTERVRKTKDAVTREPSPEERKRGYVLFSHPCGDMVYPHTRPEPDESLSELKMIATPGEYEPAAFTIWPLRDLAAVTVVAGALKNERGVELPADALAWSIVKYVERGLGPGRYKIEPRTLLPYAPRDLARDVARRYWLTARVPADQPPGTYRGTVAVSPKDGPRTTVPLAIRVLPFKLVKDAGIAYGMYYYAPDSTVYRNHGRGPVRGKLTWAQERSLKLTAADLRDQVAHGMNCAAMDPVWGLFREKDGAVIADEGLWDWQDRLMDLYVKAGLGRPLPAYSMHIMGLYLPDFVWTRKWQVGGSFSARHEKFLGEAVREYYKRAHAARAKGRWPEVIYYASDELSNYKRRGVDYGASYLKMLRRIRKTVPGGFRICSSINGSMESALLPLLDIVIPNNGYGLGPDAFDRIRRNGCEFWAYNIGFDRFTKRPGENSLRRTEARRRASAGLAFLRAVCRHSRDRGGPTRAPTWQLACPHSAHIRAPGGPILSLFL